MVMAIALTALVTGLLELVLHWFPWQLLLRRELPRQAAYVLGVLAIIIPLSCLLAHWGVIEAFWAIAALWVVVVAAGGAVMGAYGLDWLFNRLSRGAEAEEMLDEARAQAERAGK